jgi:acyl-CoA synthetase (AMP-forming)/AMP-acid ligase II
MVVTQLPYPSSLEKVREMARHDAQRMALVFEPEQLTYGQLQQHSNAVAHALRREGVGVQTRIALLDLNHPAFLEIFLGCIKARCTLTPLNARLAPPEIGWVLKDACAPLLFVGRDHYAAVEAVESQLPQLRTIVALHGGHSRWPSYQQWRAAPSDVDPLLEYSEDDDIIQLYTSGTTGNPKGVCHSHRTWGHATRAVKNFSGDLFNEDCVMLVALPLFHVAGFNPATFVLSSGGCIVMTRRPDPAEIVELMQRRSVTNVMLVPSLILAMVNLVRGQRFPALRRIGYGAAPMSESLLSQARQLFACPFEHVYGMTETIGCITNLPPSMHTAESGKLRSCGRPYDGCDVRIVDAAGQELPADAVGEIIMRSAWIMRGYWKQPEATAATIRDGWLWTGDAGYLDTDGYLYIHDRVKDMIKSGEENIFPAEVENAIYGHPAVADVAVIGVPDARWGEAVKAVVVLKPSAQLGLADLQQYLRGHIGGFKIPRSLTVVPALPRNASGKVLRRLLRDQFANDKAD